MIGYIRVWSALSLVRVLTQIDDITSGSVIKLITVAHNMYYEGRPENDLRF